MAEIVEFRVNPTTGRCAVVWQDESRGAFGSMGFDTEAAAREAMRGRTVEQMVANERCMDANARAAAAAGYTRAGRI